ncbi:MAG: FAD:protein FMN transferase [Clostridia bacterium]|nr:FAD:protein FMN transferase [Clostridia bacterium]
MDKKKITLKDILPLIILGVLVCAVVVAILLRGEKTKPESVSYYGLFDTETSFTDYSGMDGEEFGEICGELYAALEGYHKLFDIYNEYDGLVNLAAVNKNAGKGAVRVPEELVRLLEFSKEMYTLTGGEVNVAMGAVLSLWHERREAVKMGEIGTLPDSEALARAAEHCDIDKLIVDPVNMTVELTDGEMSLDVGAIAKGYAVERLADILKAKGISGFVINVGGNLRVVGEKPSGEGWLAGIENPKSENGLPYVKEMYISDTSFVTSGDYMRYLEVDGVRYHHIIDKDTLMPSGYFSSVSILTEDSGLADALSTALFSMSVAEGRALVESLSGDRRVDTVVWVGLDGEVTTFEAE